MTYTFLLTLHVLTMSLFFGFLFFLTYILPRVKKKYKSESVKLFAKSLSSSARSFMLVNVTLLWISGSLLLLSYYSFEALLAVKISIATVLITLFYAAPYIFKVIDKKYPSFHSLLHHGMIVAMVIIITIAIYS